jgi:hypothetical protein
MSSQTVTVNNGGCGLLLTLLGVLFIGLKLTGYIDWSWWLILLPIYGPLIFFLGFFVFIFIVALKFDALRK